MKAPDADQRLHLHITDEHVHSIVEAGLNWQFCDALGLDAQHYVTIDVTFGLGICDIIDTNHPHDCLILNRYWQTLEEIVTGASLSPGAQADLIASNSLTALSQRITTFATVMTGILLGV